MKLTGNYRSCVQCADCSFIRSNVGYEAKIWNSGAPTPCDSCGKGPWIDVVARKVFQPELLKPSTWFTEFWETTAQGESK